jgi:hypothetical protein
VLTDETMARNLGARAAATVRERFGWDKAATIFAESCERAVRAHETRAESVIYKKDLRTAQ